MKESTSLSFIKSGSASLFLYVSLFFTWGWWNVLGVILLPVYFVIIELTMLALGKGESDSSRSQLQFYLQSCMSDKQDNIQQEIESCIAGYKWICRRVSPKVWKEMKNHLMLLYNAKNGQSYYDILCVSPSSTMSEVKMAYRELSKKYHPDANHGKSINEVKVAEEMFKKINEAYTIIKANKLKL